MSKILQTYDQLGWLGSAMFGHVAIVLMMHIMSLPAQATRLSCNLDIHYRMYNSGKLVKCVDCRTCGLGLQPDPPCGIIIGKDTSIGPCKPCPNGYFSSKKDTKNCEKCQSESCFPHQVIEGTCTLKSDTSKCIDKCVTGYQMNAYQTKCVRNKPDNSTTTTTPPSNHPMTPMKSPPISPSINPPTTTPGINSPPPTSTLTPSKMDLKTKRSTILITHYTSTEKPEVLLDHTHNDSSLSTGVVIAIIIAILIVIIVIMVILVWYLRGFGAGLPCAKPHAGGEENVRFIKEEEHKETGLPSSKMHCPETSGGFESSKPPDAAVSSLPNHVHHN